MDSQPITHDLANATVRIECGTASGSGFQFLREDIIVTNCHVIQSHVAAGTSVTAWTEEAAKSDLQLLAASVEDEHDFAILRALDNLGPCRKVLEAQGINEVMPGSEVAFAGFPHGIRDLLVHRAFISGRYRDLGFYMDGSVNAGNSGGPIVEVQSGNVIGITTAKRFLGAVEMSEMSREADQLRSYLDNLGSRGSVTILGVDFAEFARLSARSFYFIKQVIDANANSGIGIGYHIEFALQKCHELGIS